MTLHFEPILPSNADFLWEMLYQAIFVLPGSEAPAREIVRQPELARYAAGWGRDGDLGFYAMLAEPQPLGAAWLRQWPADNRGYGWVDDQTPELSLAVLPDHRGQGIGSRLLAHLLEQARLSCPAVSLSVSAENPAVHLYQRAGFRIVREEGSSLTMLLDWRTGAAPGEHRPAGKL